MVAAILALPMLELTAANPFEAVDRLVLLIGWAAVFAIASLVLVVALRRSELLQWRVAVLLTAGGWLFFNVPTVLSAYRGLGIRPSRWLITWGLTSLGVLGLSWMLSRWRPVRLYAAVLAPALLVLPLGQTALSSAATSDTPQQAPRARDAPVAEDQISPDVYYLVLDEYARADTLQELGIARDVRSFQSDLADRGVDVAEGSWANYPLTFVSVASTLEMEYLADDGDQIADRSPFYAMLGGENETVRRLRALDYRYVHAEAILWGGSDCSGIEDVCIHKPDRLGETERALLSRTPVGPFLADILLDEEAARHTDPAFLIDRALDAVPESPKFVYAHILAPHPPHLRAADCSLNKLTDVRLRAPDDIEGYADALQCLNRQLLEAVDRILASAEDPVIVIQSDHGSAFRVNFEKGTGVRERLANFSAIRLPSSCDQTIPDDLTAVNTFRLVFACLEGSSHADLLPDRFYWSDYDDYLVTSVDPRER